MPPAENRSKLLHSENVYSYFLFAVPLEDKKNPNKVTWNRVLAYTLVIFTLALQGILLFTIFEKVVNGDARWRRSILNPRGDGFLGTDLNPYATKGEDQCNDGKSLCLKENGTYTCAPPSVQLTGRWTELDVDGDGIWDRSEAEALRTKMQCRFAVNIVEVFDVFVKFLIARENIIWIHPDLRAGKMIHKSYFTYASGDIIMCGYRNTDMCSNLLERGVFDGPLRYGTAPRVGKTIDTALEYCFKLLSAGGTCERTLPSTYSVWKKASHEQCRDPDYEKYVYTHPLDNRTKSMLTVCYEAVEDYNRAGSMNLFVVFKSIVVGIYLLAMLGEAKAIIAVGVWIREFPTLEPTGDSSDSQEWCSAGEESQEDAEAKKEPQEESPIPGITHSHRMTMVLLTIVRFFMLAVLTWVGLMFLLKDTDYIELLLNALGLIVVVELTENVYTYLLSRELREEVEEVGHLPVPVRGDAGFFTRQPAAKDLVVLVLFVVSTISVMCLNHVVIVRPLTESLECACLSQGPNCFEANRFSYDFWHEYWTEAVPQVFSDLAKMKASWQNSEDTMDISAMSTLTDPKKVIDVSSEEAIGAIQRYHRPLGGLAQREHRGLRLQSRPLPTRSQHGFAGKLAP